MKPISDLRLEKEEIHCQEAKGGEETRENNQTECVHVLRVARDEEGELQSVLERDDCTFQQGNEALLDSQCIEKQGAVHHDTYLECRICRSKEDEPLISPCKCAGSSKWIHESCLVRWLQVSRSTKCELCSQKVIIHKLTKPIYKWKRPKSDFGPCSKVDLWYLFVTLFSLGTIIGFAIFQGCYGAEESAETIVVFVAIYILCFLMIILRIRYFYLWFTRRSTFLTKWRRLNQEWNILPVDEATNELNTV